MKKSLYYILFSLILILVTLSCDDRTATEEEVATYTVEVSSVSVADGKLVGEDIAGSTASTNVTAVVTSGEEGTPAKNVLVSFSAVANGGSIGSFDIANIRTDDDGIAVVNFDDENNHAVDDATTATYEGVKVTATVNENSKGNVKFNVYENLTDVWPYKLYVTTDVASINLDNGLTKANIEARLLNKLNKPLANVAIEFESDKGFIETDGTTDTDGTVNKEFSDLGTPADIGLANITATFDHPGATTISDSVQIAIVTQYNLALETFPVVIDANNNLSRVGEDVSGDNAMTMIIATVTDTSDNPVSGIELDFTATVLGSEVGAINVQEPYSSSTGKVYAYFDDLGNEYRDAAGTPSFEGVTITASYGDDVIRTKQFNVYDSGDVWPYSLVLNTDTDEILVDNGETQAEITVRLLNALGLPVKNVVIAFDADHGFISPTGITDSTGVDTLYFTDLGDPEDVGVTTIDASFVHPGFTQTISRNVQVMIRDDSFSECSYIEIPPSIPGHIVVKDGGGLESTFIKAEVYDDEGNLVDTPTLVNFRLEGAPSGVTLNDGGAVATAYTNNGVATVTVNSGTEPGAVRVVVTVDCDEDGSADIQSTAVPVIIASGAPYFIEPEYDPQSTTPTGGGFYETQAAALVYDRWFNPVECSTYVYWTIDPIPPDTVINAEIDGVSFTCNENNAGETYDGLAFTNIRYATDAIGDFGRVRATTYGADGEEITALINDNEAVLFFVPGEIVLTSNIQYHDFTFPLPTTTVTATITARVVDFYGNEVVDVPIAFAGIGVGAWGEVGFEAFTDIGVNGFGAGDGCYTWRDYGIDDVINTDDWGEDNYHHDGFDIENDGIVDSSEVGEPWDDFGYDGVADTDDIGEDNGSWDGYHMINCEPLVRTDENGIARIFATFNRGLCTLQNVDDSVNPPICTYEDFTATLSATIMIAEITTSDPLEIQLVRTPDNCN